LAEIGCSGRVGVEERVDLVEDAFGLVNDEPVPAALDDVQTGVGMRRARKRALTSGITRSSSPATTSVGWVSRCSQWALVHPVVA
jgi:hypothetical protein